MTTELLLKITTNIGRALTWIEERMVLAEDEDLHGFGRTAGSQLEPNDGCRRLRRVSCLVGIVTYFLSTLNWLLSLLTQAQMWFLMEDRQ